MPKPKFLTSLEAIQNRNYLCFALCTQRTFFLHATDILLCSLSYRFTETETKNRKNRARNENTRVVDTLSCRKISQPHGKSEVQASIQNQKALALPGTGRHC